MRCYTAGFNSVSRSLTPRASKNFHANLKKPITHKQPEICNVFGIYQAPLPSLIYVVPSFKNFPDYVIVSVGITVPYRFVN